MRGKPSGESRHIPISSTTLGCLKSFIRQHSSKNCSISDLEYNPTDKDLNFCQLPILHCGYSKYAELYATYIHVCTGFRFPTKIVSMLQDKGDPKSVATSGRTNAWPSQRTLFICKVICTAPNHHSLTAKA